MKTTKILGATTLAGALLFTGLGHADAAENVTKSQAEDSVKNLVTNNNNFHPKEGTKFTEFYQDDVDYPVDNSYPIIFGEEPNQSPTTLFVKKDTGDIYNYDGNLIQKGSASSEDTTQNNSQSAQSTDNSVAIQDNTQQQTQVTDNNTTAQNNTQEQSQAKALPETGEESSNATLVTMIASVLLAAGSLLTFKRFSKEK
ncbi:LPXTG cell wall anchor domain-containing protein (plasmid) [Staphylococcus warneri]|uniref:LPXTG cell wall anchor domain-containing protein n=1 Tax=Staphylococcus warneri TaxID=1292 RepID=UPI003CE9A6C4